MVAELQSRESRSWQESFHYPFVLVHHVIEAIFDLCPPNQDFAKSTVRLNYLILNLRESSLSLNSYQVSPKMSTLISTLFYKMFSIYLVFFIL